MKNNLLVFALFAACLFASCDPNAPTAKGFQSRITAENDPFWSTVVITDTIKPEIQQIPVRCSFGIANNIKETLSDILYGDPVRSLNFITPKGGRKFEPYTYVRQSDGKEYEAFDPFVDISLCARFGLDENGKLLSGYYSSAISSKYYGAIICNQTFHFTDDWGPSTIPSCSAGYWKGNFGYNIPISGASMTIESLENDEYRITLRFCANFEGRVRYFYYEYEGTIDYRL